MLTPTLVSSTVSSYEVSSLAAWVSWASTAASAASPAALSPSTTSSADSPVFSKILTAYVLVRAKSATIATFVNFMFILYLTENIIIKKPTYYI